MPGCFASARCSLEPARALCPPRTEAARQAMCIVWNCAARAYWQAILLSTMRVLLCCLRTPIWVTYPLRVSAVTFRYRPPAFPRPVRQDVRGLRCGRRWPRRWPKSMTRRSSWRRSAWSARPENCRGSSSTRLWISVRSMVFAPRCSAGRRGFCRRASSACPFPESFRPRVGRETSFGVVPSRWKRAAALAFGRVCDCGAKPPVPAGNRRCDADSAPPRMLWKRLRVTPPRCLPAPCPACLMGLWPMLWCLPGMSLRAPGCRPAN